MAWRTVDDPGFQQAWQRADRHAKDFPELLTEVDLETLAFLDPNAAQAAAERRTKALTKRPPDPAPVPTKAAPPAGAVAKIRAYFDPPTDAETIVEHAARAPVSATPLAYFSKLWAFCKDMNEANTRRNARLDALEAKVRELEARPAATVKYAGVWVAGRTYAEAELATRSGGLWLATRQTTQTPSQGRDWLLVVKSGAAAPPKPENT